MNTRARAVLAALLLSTLATAPPAQAAKYRVRWLLAHKNLDYFTEAAENFKKTVERGSGGEIEVVVETSPGDASVGPSGSPEIAKSVAAGEAEMGHSFTDVIAGVDPRFMIFDAPYLFRGYRHMEGVIEGPIGAELLSGLKDKGMVGLCLTYSGGASGVATTAGREIRRPEDLKGLKVGVYGHDVNRAWLKSLGAVPVSFGHRLDELPRMEQAGEIDAVVSTWRNFERGELYPGFARMNLMGSTYLVSVSYANRRFFESLPEKYQKLLRDASQETARIERAKTIQLNEHAKEVELGLGAQSVHLSDAARRDFDAALKPAYAKIEKRVGADLIRRARGAPDGPEHPEVSIVSDFAVR